MKKFLKPFACFCTIAAASLLIAPSTEAATKPASIFKFRSIDTFSVRSKGWRDPAFGNRGWTHHSDWGTFYAAKGSMVTIHLSAPLGIHPGVSVWLRNGNQDSAPNDYVADHFYVPNQDIIKMGAIDDTTGDPVGDIVMKIAAYGYDVDGNTTDLPELNPLTDGTSGEMALTFEVTKSGQYMFAVGGISPDASIDTSLKYDVQTSLTIIPPTAP